MHEPRLKANTLVSLLLNDDEDNEDTDKETSDVEDDASEANASMMYKIDRDD
jgi:hypothetical protein